MTTGAFVEELTGVGWHLKVFGEPALGACESGFRCRLHELFAPL